MTGFADIHAHFLYGVDDGAKNRSAMEDMLDEAYKDGISSIFATPHVVPGIEPMDQALIHQRLTEAKHYCRMRGYDITLYAGAEILFTPVMERFAREKELPTMGGSSQILLQFVPDISFREMCDAIDMLMASGYYVILAHVERYECMFQRNNAYRLKNKFDLKYQMNCGSILKSRGLIRNMKINQWLKDELIDYIATDSHDTVYRPSRMSDAYKKLQPRLRKEYLNRIFGLRTR